MYAYVCGRRNMNVVREEEREEIKKPLCRNKEEKGTTMPGRMRINNKIGHRVEGMKV
jgi:hypothetical protein